jgi:hypothetical protein
MGKLSRAKREARLLGKPERLADMIHSRPLRVHDVWVDEIEGLCDNILASTVVLADNVMDYFASSDPGKEWAWLDLPAFRLPFDRLFVESKAHPVVSSLFGRFGILFVSGGDAQSFIAEGESRGFGKVIASRILEDLPMLREKCCHIVHYGAVASIDRRGTFITPVHRGTVFLDSDFRLLRGPLGQVDPLITETSTDDPGPLKNFLFLTTFPLFLAVGFMNCKNVTIEPHDPDPAINRERRKAGRKPFVRYHTINIEPMKRVLRTEGQVDKVGLARALHIVRGHFATYTPEKPLFGRVAGTVWRPAHVRGSADEGIVVSDYEVGSPKP